MTRRRLTALAASICVAGLAFSRPHPQPVRPKLVLGIVIDQFRYDYLTRFRPEYTGGLARLLRDGAVFTNAQYRDFPTVTAIGHATFLTGATPSISGIAGNGWLDRELGKNVTSVSDPKTQLLGAGASAGEGASPRKLLVSTVGDELKMASRGKSRVIGVSLKDRAAILSVGHSANGAFWYDSRAGNFVSSTFYFSDLPRWARDFNAARFPDRYRNAEWKPLVASPDYPDFSKRMPAKADAAFYASLPESPYGNELLQEFAERAIEGEQLGSRDATDLLVVSFSSNDYVGHPGGPEAPEVRDMALRTDRVIGKLLEFVDHRVGLGNTLIVLTADHGVGPLPEAQAQRKMPGGRMSRKRVEDAVNAALLARFGAGAWVSEWEDTGPCLNQELMRTKKLDPAEVEQVAANAIAALPHMFRVFTRQQILRGEVIDDAVSRAVTAGYFPGRSADVVFVQDPYWILSSHGATHGSPFSYDAHVPVIFLGSNVRPGRYNANIAPNDIAPTLATMLDIETPSGSDGRTLAEMLANP